MKNMGNAFTKLSKEINKFNDVLNTMSILIWDSRTKMPKKGANSRGYQVGTLTSVARDILLSSKMRKLLDESQNETHNLDDDSFEKKSLLHLNEAISYHDKIPEKLQVKKAELEPLAHNAWADAREKKDFKIFQPYLEEQVNIAIEQAHCIGYKDHPYDALMQRFEPGETVKSLKVLFDELKIGLGEILSQTSKAEQPNKEFLFTLRGKMGKFKSIRSSYKKD